MRKQVMRNEYSAVSVDLPCQYKEGWLPSPSLSAEIQLSCAGLLGCSLCRGICPSILPGGKLDPSRVVCITCCQLSRADLPQVLHSLLKHVCIGATVV